MSKGGPAKRGGRLSPRFALGISSTLLFILGAGCSATPQRPKADPLLGELDRPAQASTSQSRRDVPPIPAVNVPASNASLATGTDLQADDDLRIPSQRRGIPPGRVTGDHGGRRSPWAVPGSNGPVLDKSIPVEVPSNKQSSRAAGDRVIQAKAEKGRAASDELTLLRKMLADRAIRIVKERNDGSGVYLLAAGPHPSNPKLLRFFEVNAVTLEDGLREIVRQFDRSLTR